MTISPRKLPVFLCLCASALMFGVPEVALGQAKEEPIVRQVLAKSGSAVTFGVRSPTPALNMTGSFAAYSGVLLLHPEGLERSAVELALDMQSARLSPDQVLQAVFLQTALSQAKYRRATFKSTAIRSAGPSKLLVDGNYTWRGKVRTATVPVQLVRTSSRLTELRLLLDGTMKEKDVPPEIAQIGGKSASGWAKATLVFSRPT